MGTHEEHDGQEVSELTLALVQDIQFAETDPAAKQALINGLKEAAKTHDPEEIKLAIRAAMARVGVVQEGFFLAEKLIYEAGLGPKPRGYSENSTTIVGGRAIRGFNPRARWG